MKDNQMSRITRHVLKAAEVTLDDPFQLSLDPAAAAPCAASRSAPAVSSVRITQNHPDYAVLEVTCPCGRTTHVRCDYAAASPSPVRQEPSQE
jgi:23S rRNA-/tRNA-specific pseudouridylate synthase